MTFRFYRTFHYGPIRVTASRSGISTSIGTRRARVGYRPGRRQVRTSVRLPGGWRLRTR
jgi:hypothetical protein